MFLDIAQVVGIFCLILTPIFIVAAIVNYFANLNRTIDDIRTVVFEINEDVDSLLKSDDDVEDDDDSA